MANKIFYQVIKLLDLEEGDIIRNVGSSEAYVVTGNYGRHVTAVRTVDVTNVIEWEVLRTSLTLPKQDDSSDTNKD